MRASKQRNVQRGCSANDVHQRLGIQLQHRKAVLVGEFDLCADTPVAHLALVAAKRTMFWGSFQIPSCACGAKPTDRHPIDHLHSHRILFWVEKYGLCHLAYLPHPFRLICDYDYFFLLMF